MVAPIYIPNALNIYDTKMRCNLYQTGAIKSTADIWTSSTQAGIIAGSGGAIARYGMYPGAQRMKYLALPDTCIFPSSDTLIDYYFADPHIIGRGYNHVNDSLI